MGCICATARCHEDEAISHKDSSKSTLHLIPNPSISSRDVVAKPRNPSRNAIVPQLPQPLPRVVTSPGWPSWLASVAADAIKGWAPRRAESFEKLAKVGQGTYSSVYKARDLETGKIVAMKKVRFMTMDPDSVRFMAREIHILRKLDHPNVMKLECLVTSRLSGSLYLVFEYMEHDLAGLAATPGIRFTERQIKCYMQQLFRGLEHCHKRGVLHRDIKGSNLLINNDGVLKIGDFGLATFYTGDQVHPLTSRVVTLWYRAPELLLGATEYGPVIDLWSAGCILAELFSGKPIMPGRTEVEQMHRIFKLCGSPSEDYWQRTKWPLARSFRPHQPYKRVLAETFTNFPPTALALVDRLLSVEIEKRGSATSSLRSEFFMTEPLPASPTSLPKYPPSKELDSKLRNEEARKQTAEDIKKRGAETMRTGRPQDLKHPQTPEFIVAGQSKVTCISHKFKTDEEGGTGFRIEPPRRFIQQNSYAHATSMIHPIVAGSSWNRGGGSTTRQASGDLKSGRFQAGDCSGSCHRREASKDSATDYAATKNRIHYSGPLMPAGGNIEDMLKEHERQIQQAVRKARLEKSATATKKRELMGQQRRTARHAR